MNPSGVECITVAQYYDFCLGNALKYIWRAGHKPVKEGYATPEEVTEAKIQDLKKAVWYLEREIKMLDDKQKEFKETIKRFDNYIKPNSNIVYENNISDTDKTKTGTKGIQ